jgi:isopentenyl-diphosphate delta-isomerase
LNALGKEERVKEKDISDRKKEHIELAMRSQLAHWSNDKRFYYEPLLGKHPDKQDVTVPFFGKKLRFPIWVSSMTGGTREARLINENLARGCNEFGLGMGLGSCRPLLEDPKKYLQDFAVRSIIGPKQPLFANLGIAQIEKSIALGETAKIEDLVGMLAADGLIVHVNPLQEYIQSEGDRINNPPIQTIKTLMEKTDLPLIVKEVGQGMGPKSLKELMQLPVIIEFGAYGGTNFSQLEINRRDGENDSEWQELAYLGHTADEMVTYFNNEKIKLGEIACQGVIISGGIKTYLDGYYFVKKLNHTAMYGQASAMLHHARISYESLRNFIGEQIDGYLLASELLTLR